MSEEERALYDDIDSLAREVYANAPGINQTAMGFIMTTYRRRLGSSPYAFAQTCRNLMQRRQHDAARWREIGEMNGEEMEDALDGSLPGTVLAAPGMARLEQAARDAVRLERRDTKLRELNAQLDALRIKGHLKIIIFTQFRDTMLYLSRRLEQKGYRGIVRISGQEDEEHEDRSQRIKALIDSDTGLLLCTEAASESLNLQFCSAMVNYDIPWNPMKLEQRIGRIDRIGQEYPEVDIVNLFYEDTAEWDAYEAMRERLVSIHGHVGEYQPILYDPATANQLADIIRGNAGSEAIREAVRSIKSETRLNLDTLNSDLATLEVSRAQVAMQDLRQALEDPSLLPKGWHATPAGGAHWLMKRPDGKQYVVTTDRASYEYAPQYVEWFGPGSPSFPA